MGFDSSQCTGHENSPTQEPPLAPLSFSLSLCPFRLSARVIRVFFLLTGVLIPDSFVSMLVLVIWFAFACLLEEAPILKPFC